MKKIIKKVANNKKYMLNDRVKKQLEIKKNEI
jgi:hypothetical protein